MDNPTGYKKNKDAFQGGNATNVLPYPENQNYLYFQCPDKQAGTLYIN
jgi:hypothetical protein